MPTVAGYLKQNPSFKDEVMNVTSPRKKLNGLGRIVKIGNDGAYAIVTLMWMKKPALGIRWFVEYPGMPSSHGYRTWFIIPGELWEAMISTMEPDIQKYVKGFLKIN